MFVRLSVFTERGEGREILVEPGRAARVGRLEGMNDLAVPDPHLAPTHFAIRADEKACTIVDLSRAVKKHPRCSATCFLAELRNDPCPSSLCRVHDLSGETGVYVNRLQVRESVVKDGDAIVAGTTGFRVTLHEQPPTVLASSPAEPRERARLLSAGQKEKAFAHLKEECARVGRDQSPLYAVVDAARDPRVLDLLHTHDQLFYSLYDGPEGEKFAEIAPYLVALAPGSRLLEALVGNHFGQSWFTLALSPLDFKAVRRHLRRFLMVENERGEEVYFRFYDPRVLRVFLPTCTREQTSDFFGPVVRWLVESEHPGELSAFSQRDGALQQEHLRL